jgi:hypothetical protein
MPAHPTGLFYCDSIRSQKAFLVIEGERELGVRPRFRGHLCVELTFSLAMARCSVFLPG